MLATIYGNKNGTQDSIAWLLSEEPNIGPQIYNAPWKTGTQMNKFEDPILGAMVEDRRSNKLVIVDPSTSSYNDVESSGIVYETHIETMRHMENDNENASGRVNFVDPFRIYEKDFQILVWSNYFGATKSSQSIITSDKLILCNATLLEDCFHYVISHAFKMINHKKIDDQSEVWWQDHVYLDGLEIGLWKDIWYNTYQDKMHKEFDTGTLKYMWQINFLHWDLYHALKNKDCDPHELKLLHFDDFDRLFEDKLVNENHNEMKNTIQAHRDKNIDHIVVEDPNWWTQIDLILDYLNINKSTSLTKNLESYVNTYSQKREWFDNRFSKYINKYT